MADEVYKNYDMTVTTCSGTGSHFTLDEDNFESDGTKKGYCWKLCPYSTQWSDRYKKSDGTPHDGYYRRRVFVTDLTGKHLRDQLIRVPVSDQTNHTTTNGRMKIHARAGKFGFLCTDPACKYYIDHGKYFFEV